MTNLLITEKRRNTDREEDYMKMEVENGVMQPPAAECLELSEAGTSKE